MILEWSNFQIVSWELGALWCIDDNHEWNLMIKIFNTNDFHRIKYFFQQDL